ncbi:MAG: ribosomal protein S18-alanine N-acetyltransferase [Clostridia bacterium]|nr:ribosomal protein S18-alanine N-acetyltransferase [Clostridia bacterium]
MTEIVILDGVERLDEICAMEEICFSDPWSRDAFESTLDSGFACMLGALDGDRLVGYALIQCIGGDAELLNIAVSPACRGCGIGRALLEAGFSEAVVRGCEMMFLEVRESNASARALYEKAGFAKLGVRRGYYTHPREDAVMMGRGLEPVG